MAASDACVSIIKMVKSSRRILLFATCVVGMIIGIAAPKLACAGTLLGMELGASNLTVTSSEEDVNESEKTGSYINKRAGVLVGIHAYSEEFAFFGYFGLLDGSTLDLSDMKDSIFIQGEAGLLFSKLLDFRCGVSAAQIDDKSKTYSYFSAGVVVYKNIDAYLTVFYSHYNPYEDHNTSSNEIGIKVLLTDWK